MVIPQPPRLQRVLAGMIIIKARAKACCKRLATLRINPDLLQMRPAEALPGHMLITTGPFTELVDRDVLYRRDSGGRSNSINGDILASHRHQLIVMREAQPVFAMLLQPGTPDTLTLAGHINHLRKINNSPVTQPGATLTGKHAPAFIGLASVQAYPGTQGDALEQLQPA